MAGGLAALLDDIAALAKLAAASVDDVGAAAGRASAKAAGVVIDDTAVTPRYVHGFQPQRELPIVRKIAVGSLRNKLLFILPAALLLSQFLPWLLTPILMVGGTYLAYEGAEKIWELISGHAKEHTTTPVAVQGEDTEKSMVRGAIRTDFILSAEIMVIALNEVADEPFLSRAIILAVVALAITVLVYGVVGLIVKMDDIGLHLAERATVPWPRSAAGWCARCRRCCRSCRPSASSRCCGSAGTSCSPGSTSWAGTPRTSSCTTWRRPWPACPASAASWRGSSTRSARPWSGSWSAPWSSASCT